MIPTVVAYCRRSTRSQTRSCEIQESVIRAWCKRSGHALSAVVHYTSGGGSAALSASLADAVRLASQSRSALVVSSLDRLTRSPSVGTSLLATLHDAGVRLRSLAEGVDTAVPGAALEIESHLRVAERERVILVRRTTQAMTYLRGARRLISHRVPLGWDLAEDGHTLRRNQDEARLIERIARLRDGGATYSAIADMMRAEGVPTKMGGLWYPSTVHAILRRRAKT